MAVRCLFAVFPLVCDALRLGRGGPGAKANITAVGEGDVGALMDLNGHFDSLYANIGPEYGYVRSGPWSVSMARDGSPGQGWDVQIGPTPFRITIQDSTGLSVDEVMGELGKVPPSVRHAYVIVSEPGHDGVGYYSYLDGACGHGGENYINMGKGCGGNIAAHEAGHTLDQRVTNRIEPGLLDQFAVAAQWDQISISSYGNTNTWEGFAEFTRLYSFAVRGGSSHLYNMRNLSPQRFGLFEHALYRAGGGAPTLPMCWCRTPGQGTVNYNGFSCNDGSTGWCAADQHCWEAGWWKRDQPDRPPCRRIAVR